MWAFHWHELLEDQVGNLAAGVVAIAFIFVFFLSWNLFLAPAKIDKDQRELIVGQREIIENLEKRMSPNIEVHFCQDSRIILRGPI